VPYTALHAALNVPAGDLTADIVVQAAAAGTVEGDNLDWKSKLPAQKNLADSELPKDAAAFANATGGLLVFGVTETEGAAESVVGVDEFTENYERSIRQCLQRNVQPPLYNVRISPATTDDGKTVVTVLVPQSAHAPHFIKAGGDHTFRAPLRDGRDTDFMTEPAIERAYRSRLSRQADATAALDGLYNRVLGPGRYSDNAWFVGVATPVISPWHAPRRLREDTQVLVRDAVSAVDSTSDRYFGALGFVAQSLRPTMRGWTAPPNDPTGWHPAHVTILDDGSVGVSAAAGGFRGTGADDRLSAAEMQSTVLESFVADMFALMRTVGEADGVLSYDVRIEVERLTISQEPLTITSRDSHGYVWHTGVTVTEVTPVRATVSLGDDWRAQARDLALDLVNQGGVSSLFVVPAD
jgi:hypothetical protein